MAFEPDIVIVDEASKRPLVVVEAKLRLADRDQQRVEDQLSKYMVAARCPVGLLATPDRLILFADRLRTSAPGSVIRVGDFELSGVPDRPLASEAVPHRNGRSFEIALHSWLERLADDGYRQSLPSGLREAVEQYLLPAIVTGQVRTTGPRWTADAAIGG